MVIILVSILPVIISVVVVIAPLPRGVPSFAASIVLLVVVIVIVLIWLISWLRVIFGGRVISIVPEVSKESAMLNIISKVFQEIFENQTGAEGDDPDSYEKPDYVVNSVPNTHVDPLDLLFGVP